MVGRLRCGIAAAVLVVGCSAGDPGGNGASGSAGGDACAPDEVVLSDGTCSLPGTQPDGCAAGSMMVEGICLEAGDPASGCAAGELLVDGACQAAGIPEDGCVAGLAHDGEAGCVPVLPATPCGPGSMAVLGERACRPVAPCGVGSWGDIPVEATTVYVDAAHNGPKLGTAVSPFNLVQDALDAAAAGAIVAIAAGSYAEDLVVDKPVRLWGKCPAEVQIAGTATGLWLGDGADGSEVRAIAVTGTGVGIDVRGAEQVLIEQVWIHDTYSHGLLAFDAPPAVTSLTLRGTLVEGAHEYGVYLSGADAVIEELVVRDTAPDPTRGWGLLLSQDETTGKRPAFDVRNVVLERNAETSLFIYACDASVEAVVVRDTQPNAQQRFGRGLALQTDAIATAPADATIRGAVIERSYDGGIIVAGSRLRLEGSVVRDTAANLDKQERGYGIAVQDNLMGVRSDAAIVASLVEHNTESGIFMGGSDLVVATTVVRHTQPTPGDLRYGRGISLQHNPNTGEAAYAEVRGSVVSDNREVGIFVDGATALVDATLVRDIAAGVDGRLGAGVVAQANFTSLVRSQLTLTGSIIERSRFAGVFVAGSDATLERVAVRDTQPELSSQAFGRGIIIQISVETGLRSTATLFGSAVSDSHEVGVMVAGADADIEGILVRDTVAAPSSALTGRGLVVQAYFAGAESANAAVRYSVVERSVVSSAYVGGAEASFLGCLLDIAEATPDGLFGDGLTVHRSGDIGAATLESSMLRAGSRAGLSVFGAVVGLAGSRLDCNGIHLVGEREGPHAPLIDDLGSNQCGCGSDTVQCKMLSANLTPPDPLAVGAL